jgi:hypothetical protein
LSRDGKYSTYDFPRKKLSGYLWLEPFRIADVADSVYALMRWFVVFYVVLIWKSDRGSHVKNEVVRRFQRKLKAKRHLSTANFPWSNGTIDSTYKKGICAFRALLSELEMFADEWPEVMHMVQSVLYNSFTTRLKKRMPMQAFTGHAETILLALMMDGKCTCQHASGLYQGSEVYRG